jgi:hypothetical protein
LASILAIGLLLGWGFGGSIRALARLEVSLWWLVPIALGLQFLPIPRGDEGPGRYAPFVVLIVSFVLVGVVVVVNWRLRGFPAIFFGVLLNLIPITLNQGMPVSASAVVESGGSLADVPRELGAKHHLERPEDELTFLADVISIRPPFQAVVSIGDLLMWVGVGWFLTAAMLGFPEREPPPAPAPRRLRSART